MDEPSQPTPEPEPPPLPGAPPRSEPLPLPEPPPLPEAPPMIVAGDRSITCRSCGYDLRGVTLGSRCPECGTPVVQAGAAAMSSGKAITSMVLGIVSIVTCVLYGLPSIVLGPLAIHFSKKARVEIQTGHAPLTSEGMAKAGRICGIIGTCLGGIYVLFWIVMLGLAIAGSMM